MVWTILQTLGKKDIWLSYLPIASDNKNWWFCREDLDNLGENKENYDASWLPLASMDKKKGQNTLRDKINWLLASVNMVKDNNELSDKTDRHQMHISSLNIFKCALKEICFPYTKEQKLRKFNPKFSLKVGWITKKIKSQPLKVWTVKV